MKKVLIVGAGLFGAVCARELADAGCRVVVLERREHIGGNCFTRYHEAADCHEHVYGPHIFHTDDERVWRYVNRFTEFNSFVNRVKARHGAGLYSLPVNLLTLHQLYGVTHPEEARQRVADDCIPCANPANLEDYCLATIGRRVYA